MQKFLYFLTYPLLWLLSKLPMRILYIISTAMFLLMYYVIGYRRKVVKENLELVFPEKSIEERIKIAKGFFRHFCDMIVETLKVFTISEKEIRARFRVTNPEFAEKYYRNNQSVLLMTGHYGNWEWSGILNKIINHKGHAVYKSIVNPQLDALVKKTRERFGATAVNNKKIVSVLYRSYKKGEVTLTYLLSDQTPKMGHFKYHDTFLGIDVPMFTGAEELAKKLNFPVLFLKVQKVKRGYYTATFSTLADYPKEYPDYQITRMFFDALENQIREKPEYYLWSHKRWKHRNKDL